MYKLKYEIDFDSFRKDDPALAERVKRWAEKYFNKPFLRKEGDWYVTDSMPEYFEAFSYLLFEKDWAVKYLKTLVRDYGDGEYDEINDFVISNCEGAEKWKIRKEGV